MILQYGPIQEHEAKPENGSAVELVGNPSSLWSDNSNNSYSTIQYYGFETPWGHPYALVEGLPLSSEDAAQVTEVIATWTARVIEHDPDPDNTYRSELIVSPHIRLGAYESDYAGPNWHSLSTAAWDGADEDSLYFGVNPSAPWEELYLPEDGSWKTFRERLTPNATNRSLQQLLCHDFTGANPTPETMAANGTVDPYHQYLITYQDSYWGKELFAVSNIEIELIGISGELGRLRVNLGDQWKFASPRSGENQGEGRLKFRTPKGWRFAKLEPGESS